MTSSRDAQFVPHLLLVDDRPEFARLFIDRFSRVRMDVAHASTAREAKERFHAQHFDLVVVDWQLGNARGDQHAGLGLIGWLRERAPDLPIIVLTGVYNEVADIQIAYIKGASCYCSKSDPPDRWIAEARRLLNMPLMQPLAEDGDGQHYGITSVRDGAVYIHGEELCGLRPGMVKLMSLLVQRRGQGVSLRDITEEIAYVEGAVKAYKSGICRALRAQFGDDYGDLILYWQDDLNDALTDKAVKGYRLQRQPGRRVRP